MEIKNIILEDFISATDGRKMFICGSYFGGETKQYNLRNAWSISTSSGSQQNTLVAFGGTFPLRRPTFEEHLRVSQTSVWKL